MMTMPKDWGIVKLEELGTISTGKTPSTFKKEYWGGDIPFIRPGDISEVRYASKTERFVTIIGAQQMHILQKNAVLMVCIGSTIGKTAMTSKESIVNQQINSIECKENVDPSFVYYALTKNSKIFANSSGVAAVPIIKKSLFEKLKIPLPPLPEQHSIASVLSSVDDAINTVERERRAVERLKVGVMKKLFDGKDYEIVKLEDIAEDIYYGITAKTSHSETKLRMLRTTDINDYSANFNTLPYCEITDKRTNIEKYKVRKGDIIVARAGTVGVSILVDKDYNDVIFGSYLIKVKLKENIESKFIHYFFQSPIFWRHIGKAQGSTMLNINLPLLRSLKLPLPALEEQKHIAAVLSTLDSKLSLQGAQKEKLERVKQGLMNDLLTGKKRVKVKE